MKGPFPEFIHLKHLMGSISVMVKCLNKQGQIPVQNKEYKDDHKSILILIILKLISQIID
jgi:hypothetical protein